MPTIISIRDLLSPRKLWHLLQAWKTMRELKGMYNRVMPNYGSVNPATLPEITPENLAYLQELLGSWKPLGGGQDGEEEEE